MNIREYIRSVIKENLEPSASDDNVTRRRHIVVHYENGDTTPTEINGTKPEILDYYVGKYFNFGVEDDKLVKAISVDFIS